MPSTPHLPNVAVESLPWTVGEPPQDSEVDHWPAGLRKIRSVGIVGAGLMGTAIAAAHVRHGLPVLIHDADEETLRRAAAVIAAELAETEEVLPPASLARFVRPAALAEVGHCDLVIESIVESLAAKRQLYEHLQEHLGRHTIVTSNSSTIPIAQLTGGWTDAARFCGLHFCHPVRQRPLVEIVRGPRTSPRTIATAVAHVHAVARVPIVVEDGPGFVVNRLLFPYLSEALQLLREGTPLEAIEGAAIEFGMAMGPLRLMDEIGLDTALQAAWVLGAAFPERVVSSPLLVSLVKAGRLGQKTGAGFFCYDGSAARPAAALDPALAALLAPWIDAPPRTDSENIACRLVLPMLLEATRLLEEGKVGHPRDIDAAVLLGLGFPAATGGLLRWADDVGAPRVVALLQSLVRMGSRAEPTPMLRTLADTGGSFYRPFAESG